MILMSASQVPAPAWPSAPSSASMADARLFFDIPSQQLEAALDSYARITGHPAVFPSDLLNGRISAPLHGVYTAETALQILLQGTGLMAARRSSRAGDTFVLQSLRQFVDAPHATPSTSITEDGYAGLAQRRIWQALCADSRTRPGNYEVLLRFSLGNDGLLHDARLVGSSGNEGRDAALLQVLQRVRIERAPPEHFAGRPLTLAILPDAQGAASCLSAMQ